MADYALRVPLEKTEEVIGLAESLGVYDETRSVKKATDGSKRTEVPVTRSEVDAFENYETVEQDSPVYRKKRLENIVDTDDEPSWDVVGEIVVVDFSSEKSVEEKREIGEAILEIHRNCHTAVEITEIQGERRVPQADIVAGEGETETVHRENGFEFKLDLSEVMFSVGNVEERLRMHKLVDENETVFDMFAGIGYFSIPMAVGGAEVVATEINPTSHRYLVENACLNDVDDRIDAKNADCRDISINADRVVMGHFSSREYLDHALDSVDEGWIHIHDAAHQNDIQNRVKDVKTEIISKGRQVENLKSRKVKGYSEGVDHIVIEGYLS